MTTTSDPTAPDAVAMLQWMHACVVHSENHGDVPHIGSDEVLAVLRATQAERARHAEEVARLKARCHALEEQLGKLTELYDVTQARLEAFEEQEPDARTCAEWVATVALKSSDVHSAARRYLCGEQRGIVAQVHRENDSLRDQLRKVEGERDVSRRQCGELHERLALIVRYFEEETSEGDGIAEQHLAGYLGAKIVLVRTAPNEAAWETAMVEFAQLQERASHVPGLSAALDEARHELDALRSLLPDVRLIAESAMYETTGGESCPEVLTPAACAARRIIAALDADVEDVMTIPNQPGPGRALDEHLEDTE